MWLDVKLGLRMLRKHWALTLIGGLAMAAAMTVASAGFTLIHALLGTSVPLEEGDRVVIVQSFERWRVQVHSLVEVGAFRNVDHELRAASGLARRVTVAEMSATGFALARINPRMGRFLLPEDDRPGAPPVVVIGHDAWQSTFAADRGILGRQVQLDGISHTVVGVMPRGFRFPVNHDYWTSLRAETSDPVTVFGRLAPGATLEKAQAELDVVGIGESDLVGQAAGPGRPKRPLVKPYVVGLTGERSVGIAAVLPFVLPLLLVLPCINIGALIYARTVARQGEFAARSALGATRTRIIVQIFLEVLVLAMASALVALVLAPRVAKLLSNMVTGYGLPFWMDFGVSYGSILFTAGMAIAAAYIAGVIPARRAIGRGQLTALSALHRSSSPQLGKAWTAIVVLQLALSVAVLPIAVELAWTTLRPAIFGPGFPVKEFLTARLDLAAGSDHAAAAARLRTLSNEVVRQLAAEPGVTAVTASAYKPFAEENLAVQSGSSDSESVAFNQVDAAFFRVFGIRLLAGRGFESVDNDPQRGTILVNRSFANRVFGGENPVGRSVRVLGSNGPLARYEIVGFVDNQFAYSDQPTVYRPLTFTDARSVHLAIHVGPALVSGFESRLREITSAAASDLRVDDVQPLDEIYFFLSLAGYIAGSIPALVALGVLVFATMGIYTRMSFDVVQRRREIGIRSALGASPRHLVVGMFRSVFVPVLIGGGLGGVAALVLSFYLSPLLFSSAAGRPLPWILPAVEAFIFVIGAVALAGPVRRTLQVDATEALREG